MIHRKGKITSRHRHPVFHLIYITEGQGVFRIENCVSQAEPGHLYVITPNQWHEFEGNLEQPMSDLECTFYLSGSDKEPAVVSLLDLIEHELADAAGSTFSAEGAPIGVPLQLRPTLINRFQRLLDYTAGYVSASRTAVLISDLLLTVEDIVRACSSSSDSQYWAKQTDNRVSAAIKKYLQTHMGTTVTLADISRHVHLTPTYLCRSFKKQTGSSPMDYLQQLRMTEAEKLLLHTDLQVNLIAEKVGYHEPSYFTRVFKEKHGVSPKDFRRSIESG
jgi:AraC-like DNA-binding protein